MITTISRNDYLMLQGVLTLADQHKRTLDNLVFLTAQIIEDDEEHSDWAWEAIHERYGADELLRKINVTIEEETPTP